MERINSNVFAELMKKSHYTQKEIGDKLLISPASMQNYIKGKRAPDLRILFDLCCICEFDFKGCWDEFDCVKIDSELKLHLEDPQPTDYQLKVISNSHKAAFERFYYKLTDKNKYLQNISEFIINSYNRKYLDNEIDSIYFGAKDHEPQLLNLANSTINLSESKATSLIEQINRLTAENSNLKDENAELRGQVKLLKELLAGKK